MNSFQNNDEEEDNFMGRAEWNSIMRNDKGDDINDLRSVDHLDRI